jgi:hypothetical protein
MVVDPDERLHIARHDDTESRPFIASAALLGVHCIESACGFSADAQFSRVWFC